MGDGRYFQYLLDERIAELNEMVNKLKAWRQIIEPYTFYECDKHGVYGIRSPDPIQCKMCKRLGV